MCMQSFCGYKLASEMQPKSARTCTRKRLLIFGIRGAHLLVERFQSLVLLKSEFRSESACTRRGPHLRLESLRDGQRRDQILDLLRLSEEVAHKFLRVRCRTKIRENPCSSNIDKRAKAYQQAPPARRPFRACAPS
jgi:hypothetical protein